MNRMCNIRKHRSFKVSRQLFKTYKIDWIDSWIVITYWYNFWYLFTFRIWHSLGVFHTLPYSSQSQIRQYHPLTCLAFLQPSVPGCMAIFHCPYVLHFGIDQYMGHKNTGSNSAIQLRLFVTDFHSINQCRDIMRCFKLGERRVLVIFTYLMLARGCLHYNIDCLIFWIFANPRPMPTQ